MSEQPREPVFNKGPSGKTIAVIFFVAAGLMFIGFIIGNTARSKDEAIGAILATMLGLLLFALDFILRVIWLARRKKARDRAQSSSEWSHHAHNVSRCHPSPENNRQPVRRHSRALPRQRVAHRGRFGL